MSNEILAETSRVLRYPRMRARHGMSESRIYDYVMFLQSVATMVRPDPTLVAPIRDPNDIVVLPTACVLVRQLDQLVISLDVRGFGFSYRSHICEKSSAPSFP
jgi:predicted nucleic acid-binding protein